MSAHPHGPDAFETDGIVCRIEDGIAHVELNHGSLNILDQELMHNLLEVLAGVDRRSDLRALVIGSKLKVFSGGVDVGAHRGEEARPTLRLFHRMLHAIEMFSTPTIAEVAGHALGGGFELALACDLRVVAEEAKLGVPEITLGVFPPYAITRLPELTGRGTSARLILTGETLTGARAAPLGIADYTAPAAELGAVMAELLAGFRKKSAASLRVTKQALRTGRPEHLLAAVENVYLEKLMATEDADEGLLAFIEKRQPVWQHR